VIPFLEGNSKIGLLEAVDQLGPILSISTVSFELPAKVAEEIYVEMYIYGQLSEVEMVRDLDLDLGSGQGHINVHST